MLYFHGSVLHVFKIFLKEEARKEGKRSAWRLREWRPFPGARARSGTRHFTPVPVRSAAYIQQHAASPTDTIVACNLYSTIFNYFVFRNSVNEGTSKLQILSLRLKGSVSFAIKEEFKLFADIC